MRTRRAPTEEVRRRGLCSTTDSVLVGPSASVTTGAAFDISTRIDMLHPWSPISSGPSRSAWACSGSNRVPRSGGDWTAGRGARADRAGQRGSVFPAQVLRCRRGDAPRRARPGQERALILLGIGAEPIPIGRVHLSFAGVTALLAVGVAFLRSARWLDEASDLRGDLLRTLLMRPVSGRQLDHARGG